MKNAWRLCCVVLMLSVYLAGAVTAASASSAEFFKGKNISWIIPRTPGGGYDTYSRGIGRFMESNMGTEDVTFVFRNVYPSTVGHTTLYSAKPDGLTIGIVDGAGGVFAQLTTKINYDLTKFSWLGRVVAEPHVFVVDPKTGIKSIDDLKAQKGPIKIGEGTPSDDDLTYMGIVERILDVDFKFIVGYGGSKKLYQATMRGDVVGTATTQSSALKLIKSGDLVPILQFGQKERSKNLPNVPALSEFADTPEKKNLAAAVDSIISMGRVVAGPPGIPEDRLTVLRDAFWNTLHDPKFLEWAKSARRPVRPMPAQDVDAMVKTAFKSADTLVPIINKLLEEVR